MTSLLINSSKDPCRYHPLEVASYVVNNIELISVFRCIDIEILQRVFICDNLESQKKFSRVIFVVVVVSVPRISRVHSCWLRSG